MELEHALEQEALVGAEVVLGGEREGRQTAGQLLQGDPQLQPGQVRAQAVVGALAEGHVVGQALTVGIEVLRFGEQ